MHSATRIAVAAFLITSTLASVYQSPAKLARRDAVLYPFPRVGRNLINNCPGPAKCLVLTRLTNVTPQLQNGRELLSQEQILDSENREISTDNGETIVDKKGYRKRGLYVFPRIGRSDFPLTVDQPRMGQRLFPRMLHFRFVPPQPAMPHALSLEEEGPNIVQTNNSLLQKMMAFMQGSSNFLVKKGSAADSSGMWFGPRLGRSVKENEDADTENQPPTYEMDAPDSTQPPLIEDRKKRQTN